MDTPWIRIKDLAAYYSLGRTHSYDLVREFKATASKDDWLTDGRITLIRKEAFEEFLRGRNK
jgi:hypothetical protein